MLIQLSKLLSMPDHEETVECSLDMEKLVLRRESYPILEKPSFPVILKNEGKEDGFGLISDKHHSRDALRPVSHRGSGKDQAQCLTDIGF